eukprot:CAMPEP_0175103530 /NCGR_PEP_ID=MMETSP0086_2-20121207/9142_1 /TAXON_ID=136419 /ORGANISM="Unknown Unknown, Strain D1" /LENGTH=125 /DNA_ID=CAMNT_0016378659 /DNA_START=98 /DNA_END=474 /DNA_ORIENTATION=-
MSKQVEEPTRRGRLRMACTIAAAEEATSRSVGLLVGYRVGLGVGFRVGLLVGLLVGVLVGVLVGLQVGLKVGGVGGGVQIQFIENVTVQEGKSELVQVAWTLRSGPSTAKNGNCEVEMHPAMPSG